MVKNSKRSMKINKTLERRHQTKKTRRSSTKRNRLHRRKRRGGNGATSITLQDAGRWLEERSIDDYDDNGNTLLTLAIKQGDLEIAEYAIAQGANVNKPDEDGETPLISAVAHIDNDDYSGMQLLHLLLKKGADVNAQDQQGYTSLHYAVDFDVDGNNIEAIRQLLDTYHANPDIVSKDGSVALDMANNDVVRDFLGKRALDTLYQNWTDKPNKKSDIPVICNNETACPITYYDLDELRYQKRLVKLDGKCYSFYAFANEISIDKNPFTNQEWSEDAKKKIGLLRVHQPTLQREDASFSSKMGGDQPRRQRLGGKSRTRKLTKLLR